MDLFFDYGELLFRYVFNEETLRRAHELALTEIQLLNPGIDLEALSQAHNGVIGEYLAERSQSLVEWPMTRIMDGMLEKLDIQSPNGLETRLKTVYEENDHDAYPLTGIPELVTELDGKGHNLGIISNLPHDGALTSLERYRLRTCFDTITFSHEAGYRKPHKAIYRLALERAGIEAEDGIFFSHDMEEVEGAIRVGMQAHLTLTAQDIREVLGR
jgi:FMN phosphatase YigB (HAD superfamily)